MKKSITAKILLGSILVPQLISSYSTVHAAPVKLELPYLMQVAQTLQSNFSQEDMENFSMINKKAKGAMNASRIFTLPSGWGDEVKNTKEIFHFLKKLKNLIKLTPNVNTIALSYRDLISLCLRNFDFRFLIVLLYDKFSLDIFLDKLQEFNDMYDHKIEILEFDSIVLDSITIPILKEIKEKGFKIKTSKLNLYNYCTDDRSFDVTNMPELQQLLTDILKQPNSITTVELGMDPVKNLSLFKQYFPNIDRVRTNFSSSTEINEFRRVCQENEIKHWLNSDGNGSKEIFIN